MASTMNILVINPILYTSESDEIERASSIKDCMIYDLCIGFLELGHRVTLIGGEPFKPYNNEEYPFEVKWLSCVAPRVFKPNCLPFMPDVYRFVRDNVERFDLIISSEVFSLNSLAAYCAAPDKVIIWHELAKHNAIMKQLPSKIWYGIIARLLMKNALVVARSSEARQFISRYCGRVEKEVIDHGVNLRLFKPVLNKQDYFVVCSQLIKRKRIDGIIANFAQYLKRYDSTCHLYIIGKGDLEDALKAQVNSLHMEKNVTFTGKLSHGQLIPLLSQAMALLVNTEKDNNMVSIVESIATATPVVTTEVPLNASYIKKNQLGIAKNEWNERDLREVVVNGQRFISNCLLYRESLSTNRRAEQFVCVARRNHLV